MRLDHMCDMELTYRGPIVWVQPYGSEEGSAYGEGDGTVTGEKLRGTVRWANHPHKRSDGSNLPNAHGVIQTDDGAPIIFSLQGRTVFTGDKGSQLLAAIFEAEDERYRWLNNTFCVLEGIIEQGCMKARVYTCISEL